MARITYGAVITDIKGSIGGVTFQHNTSGFTSRRKPLRLSKNTTKQSSVINEFQKSIPNWTALSISNKETWNNFAALYEKTNKWGETKVLTGYNWYQLTNNNLNICGESYINTPPVYESPLSIPEYGAVFIDNEFAIIFTEEFAHTDHYLLFYTSPPLTSITQRNRKALRLTMIIEPGTDTYIDFMSEYQATHNIVIPLAGNPANLNIICGLLSVHRTKGIASVMRTYAEMYEQA